MTIARRATTVLAASSAMAVFGLASAAGAAPTGTITDVHAVSTGQVVATFSTSHDVVDRDGYAGWYPFASDAPPGQPCDAGSQPVIYVGDWQRDPGSQRQTKTFTIAPNHTMCLYTEHGGLDTVVATHVWVPPAPPAPSDSAPAPVVPPPGSSPTAPAPTDAPVTPASPSPAPPRYLTLTEARRVLRKTLGASFGPRFTSGRNYQRACLHLSDTRVRCRVAWDWQRYHYAGTLTILEGPSSYSTSKAIRRTPL
jgi:hypothetical protein